MVASGGVVVIGSRAGLRVGFEERPGSVWR